MSEIITRPSWAKGKTLFWCCSRCNRTNSWHVTFCPCGPVREDESRGSSTAFCDDSSTAVWDELSDEALIRFEADL